MLTMDRLETLSRMASPLVTAYLYANPSEASQHSLTPPYLVWLKTEGRAVANRLPAEEREVFLEQLNRVEEFLRDRVPHERSLVIFAGPSGWETIPLQIEVQNEIHWGRPGLGQLLWIVGEHKTHGVLVMDHAGAKFFQYWPGELTRHKEKKFEVDASEWKQKDLGHVTAMKQSQRSHGTQRDAFAKRVDNRYAHFCIETAHEAAVFYAEKSLTALFLSGPDRLIKTVERKLPKSLKQSVVAFDQDLAHLTLLEMLKHLEPHIEAWERKHEAELIAAVTNGEGAAVAGLDKTLAQLQRGKVRTLVVARGLNPVLHRCAQCGWTDGSANPTCAVCGGERCDITFEEMLPELIRRQGLQIQVVSNGAADGLKRAEGIAGWLGRPKSSSARAGI
jgi:Bacterial archaeo-eukaryotic release factor family 10